MRKERKPPKMRAAFLAHYDQYRERDGQAFDFVRRVSWRTDPDYDREVGTLYAIRFKDGEEIVAWPEEVIIGACLCHTIRVCEVCGGDHVEEYHTPANV